MPKGKLEYRLRSHPNAEDKIYPKSGKWLPYQEASGSRVWSLESGKQYWLLRFWSFKGKKRVTVRRVFTDGGILKVKRCAIYETRFGLEPIICGFLGEDWKAWREKCFVRKALTLAPGTSMGDPALGLVAHSLIPPT